MIQTTVKVSGMACAMCEAHINDAIRSTFHVEKVSSSHIKGETVILSQAPLDETTLRAAIDRRHPGCLLEVDGGIDAHTAPLALEAGADVLVAGSAVFKKADRAAAIAALRPAI